MGLVVTSLSLHVHGGVALVHLRFRPAGLSGHVNYFLLAPQIVLLGRERSVESLSISLSPIMVKTVTDHHPFTKYTITFKLQNASKSKSSDRYKRHVRIHLMRIEGILWLHFSFIGWNISPMLPVCQPLGPSAPFGQ